MISFNGILDGLALIDVETSEYLILHFSRERRKDPNPALMRKSHRKAIQFLHIDYSTMYSPTEEAAR
jgi:hypothetical protein